MHPPVRWETVLHDGRGRKAHRRDGRGQARWRRTSPSHWEKYATEFILFDHPQSVDLYTD